MSEVALAETGVGNEWEVAAREGDFGGAPGTTEVRVVNGVEGDAAVALAELPGLLDTELREVGVVVA